MKKLLFIISLLAIAGTATAQHMVVETAGGNEVFTLENLKQITFNGTTVNIEDNTGTVYSATMGDINRIYFDDQSSVADIEYQGGNLVEYISPDEISIDCNAGSTVTVYSLTGAQMITRRMNTQGGIISIAGLPQGIYIVKTEERTTKIIKR
jgi:hypothetical protein